MNQGLIMVNPRYRELRLAGRIQHTNFAPSWAPRQPEAWRSGPAEWRQWYERSICIQIIRTHIQEMVRFIYVFIKGPKVFFILHIDVWSKPLFRNQRKSNAYDIYVYVCVPTFFPVSSHLGLQRHFLGLYPRARELKKTQVRTMFGSCHGVLGGCMNAIILCNTV